MSRETQDAQVAKQAREQIEFNAGAEAHRQGEKCVLTNSHIWVLGWTYAENVERNRHGKA